MSGMTFWVCRPPSRLPIIIPIIRSMVKNQLMKIWSQVPYVTLVTNHLDQWHGFLIQNLSLLQKTVGLLIHTVWKSIDYVVCLLYIYTFDPCWPQIFGFFIRMENIGNKNPKIWGRLRSNGLYLVHSALIDKPKTWKQGL